jgi:hypothetical protein
MKRGEYLFKFLTFTGYTAIVLPIYTGAEMQKKLVHFWFDPDQTGSLLAQLWPAPPMMQYDRSIRFA